MNSAFARGDARNGRHTDAGELRYVFDPCFSLFAVCLANHEIPVLLQVNCASSLPSQGDSQCSNSQHTPAIEKFQPFSWIFRK